MSKGGFTSTGHTLQNKDLADRHPGNKGADIADVIIQVEFVGRVISEIIAEFFQSNVRMVMLFFKLCFVRIQSTQHTETRRTVAAVFVFLFRCRDCAADRGDRGFCHSCG